MNLRNLLVGAVIVLAVAGFRSSAAAAQNSTPPVTHTQYISDPTLGVDAFEVRVPQRWHFQGTLLQEGACGSVPSPAFRFTSPDGLTFVERLPAFGWTWGSGPMTLPNGCLPLQQALSAQEFLQYLSASLDVQYLRDSPVPAALIANAQASLRSAEAQMAPKYAAYHLKQPKQTRQLARAVVQFRNGTFIMQGLLAATVDCTEVEMTAAMASLSSVRHQCRATVEYAAAPKARYQTAASFLDAEDAGGRELPAWDQAWTARNQIETAQRIQQIQIGSAAQRQASAEQFAHAQAVRQHMHEQFLATMQQGTAMSMNRAAQVANANHTIASDWVDYSLDQQTVRDPNSGQVTKVSSSRSYTWMDSSGKTSFQTNDVNANPNGALAGSWTRQTVVHGDGTH